MNHIKTNLNDWLNENENQNQNYKSDIKINISDILPINKDGQTLDDAIINVKDGLISHSTDNIFLKKVGDKYEILDGFHRLAQKILNGDKYIIADILSD